ncbi:MarR family transcriptional regulator [Olsenella profusa]|uniref:MarR family transcriptional regulator n=1 Tax=Olsenella profusa TaxID=138595 RepID=A0ABS2F169_9ACTN|nr:MarR family transcriptional regulator [Olsenella profusa]
MEADTIHHLLLVTFGRSNHAMTSRTRRYGLMPGQPKVLEFVADNEGCLQRDIANACAMDRATVTGVLGRMEEAGLIERRPKEGDRRALEVRLTDAGWEAAEHVAICGAEVDEIACADMTADERDELARLLARVNENFEQEEGKGTHE